MSFIGPNNGGKSTLLKLLYETRDVLKRLAGPELALGVHPKERATPYNTPQEITDRSELRARMGTGDVEIHIEPVGYCQPRIAKPDIVVTAITVFLREQSWRAKLWIGDQEVVFDNTPDIGYQVPEGGGLVLTQGHSRADLTAILPAIESLADTLYIGPYRNAVNIGANQAYYDLQIGQAFIGQWREWQTGPSRVRNEATLTLTNEIRRIFDFEQLSINPTSNNETLQLFIDGQSRRLHEVGSGLAQFVVCLANAITRKPSWILIDEPELHLHPRLQGELVRALSAEAKEGLLFATHSIGLARSHADQLYSVRKIRHGESDVVPYSATIRLSEFLGEMGYSSLREIGYDRILLIEGPNDIQTIKTMLRWYKQEHNTILIPLGGSQTIREISQAELAEVLQITDRVAALIDSEKASESAPIDAGRQAFLRACETARIPCHVLKRRAIENYITDEAIKRVKGEKYRALQPFEKLKDLEFGWPKSENWMLAAAMTREQLAGTDLGDFLESLQASTLDTSTGARTG